MVFRYYTLVYELPLQKAREIVLFLETIHDEMGEKDASESVGIPEPTCFILPAFKRAQNFKHCMIHPACFKAFFQNVMQSLIS